MQRMLIIATIFITSVIVYAGTNTLPVETDAIIRRSHVNKFQTALTGFFVPRNSSGVAEDESGELGTSALQWLRAHIAAGYWSLGDIKMHHSYNGLVGPGEGWMLCDGRVINEVNYDAEHGAGAWATYVGSSSLEGLVLPNMTGKYPVGAATTTQDGTTTITSVGNTSHTVNIEHTHTINDHNHTQGPHDHTVNDFSHNHAWYTSGAGACIEEDTTNTCATFDGDANTTPFTSTGGPFFTNTTLVSGLGMSQTAPAISTEATPAANSLSSAQSVQPESIQVQYYMRVF